MTAHQQPQSGEWFYVLDEPARILIADDDPIFREFASVHIATPAAEVETAADGEEAWARLGSAPFDIALIDIEMPGLDGFELVERIRASADLGCLPVIM